MFKVVAVIFKVREILNWFKLIVGKVTARDFCYKHEMVVGKCKNS